MIKSLYLGKKLRSIMERESPNVSDEALLENRFYTLCQWQKLLPGAQFAENLADSTHKQVQGYERLARSIWGEESD